MRKRFWKKQWIAVFMASSMAVSTANVPLVQGVAVQAAENENTAESENIFYSGKAEIQTDKLELPEEDWGDNKPVIAYDEKIQNINITKNFTMTADVYLDEDGYNSLAEAGNYLKLQGVVKLGDKWDWTDSQDIPYLEQKNFTKTEDGLYKTQITIEFKDKTEDVLKGVYFVVVAQGFAGKVTFANVALEGKPDQQITEEKEPLVIDDFEDAEAGTDAGWKEEGGWQYEGGVTTAAESAYGSSMLKLGLDYTGCEGFTWSEAKIKKIFENPVDVSAYNLLTFDIIYPEAFNGFKTKIFAQNSTSGTEIINKEGTSEISDAGEGMKRAAVTVSFSPNTESITDITIGIVGDSTSFKGNVYIDNITLLQYDESSDFIDITSVPGEGTKADTSQMPSEINLADKDASNSTKALYSYLSALEKPGQVLFGHQNDTHKCVSKGNGIYSDTKDVTGSISGLSGLDTLALTGTELGETDVDTAINKCIEIGKAAAAEGAILTLSAHMPNMGNAKIVATPDAKRKYDFSQCDFSESKDLSNNCSQEVLPGGKYNEQYKAYLDIIADYAKGLGDIPVLFRPLHENSGGWFWWGSSTTSVEGYKALYRYTQDYLKETGVHNFIYVYSPNGPLQSEAEFNERYPGDDYVDVLSFDYYDDMKYSDTYGDSFFNGLRSSCSIIKKLADEKGKIAAIAETGVRVTRQDGSSEGIMVKDNPIKGINWYSQVNKIAKETGMSYFLLWANFSDTNFYIPYKYNDAKGHELINEFIDFYNEDSSVFANGTGFYGEAENTQVAVKNQDITSGYFINLFPMAEIKEAVTLKASVKNASVVKFILKSGNTEKELSATVNSASGYYEAELTKEVLDSLGKTNTGTVSINADGVNIVTLPNISFGKEKPVLAGHQIDDFETYAGDTGLMSSKWHTNQDAGCTLDISLVEKPRYEGGYALKFAYTESSKGWAGAELSKETDWSEYNALKLWVKPDGKNQKTVVQIKANGSDYEAYLNTYDDYKKSETPLLVTLPFSEFKDKSNGTPLGGETLKNISGFGLWVNAIADSEAFANGEETVSGILYYDDIKAVSSDKTVPVFEKSHEEPQETTTPTAVPTKKPETEPTKQPVIPSYPSYITPVTQAPAASATPATSTAPSGSTAPGTSTAPSGSAAPGTSTVPAGTQAPGTTTEIKKDDATGAVTEITTTVDGNKSTVVEKTTLPDGTQEIKETVSESDNSTGANGIITIKETLNSSKSNAELVKNIKKYTDGDVISTDATLYTGSSEIGSNYSAKNTIPESFLIDARKAGISNITLCVGKDTVDDVKANQGKRMVIKIEVPQAEGISIGKVLLTEEAVKGAVEGNRRFVVKMVNENEEDSYTVTIPPSELKKMSGGIDISIKAGKVSQTGGNKQKDIEQVLSANKINPDDASIISIASNNTEGGIKASAPVVTQSIKASGKAYVYNYNSKTGKLYEIANSKRTVLKNGMTGIEGFSGNDYVVTSKELSGKNVVTLLSQVKITFDKTSVKKGSSVKINTYLTETLEKAANLKETVPYAKQAAVITYKSSNAKAVKVSKDGTLKAAGKGKAVITVQVKLADSKVKTIKKTVTVK